MPQCEDVCVVLEPQFTALSGAKTPCEQPYQDSDKYFLNETRNQARFTTLPVSIHNELPKFAPWLMICHHPPSSYDLIPLAPMT